MSDPNPSAGSSQPEQLQSHPSILPSSTSPTLIDPPHDAVVVSDGGDPSSTVPPFNVATGSAAEPVAVDPSLGHVNAVVAAAAASAGEIATAAASQPHHTAPESMDIDEPANSESTQPSSVSVPIPQPSSAAPISATEPAASHSASASATDPHLVAVPAHPAAPSGTDSQHHHIQSSHVDPELQVQPPPHPHAHPTDHHQHLQNQSVDQHMAHENGHHLHHMIDPSISGQATNLDSVLPEQSTPKPKKERARPKPRCKSATKITRFRKITSCLQCREKKQKCDRMKPACGNCRDNSLDDPCHYVDEQQRRPGSEDDLAGAEPAAFESPLSRKRKQPQDPLIPGVNISDPSPKRTAIPAVRDRTQVRFLQARREAINQFIQIGKDKNRDFTSRVNAARAAAVADVLFESEIVLPSAEQVSSLMYTYKIQVEPFVNVVLIDINVARIQNFLRWWHSRPATVPADPSLVPLLLVILALALQARRCSPDFGGKPLTHGRPVSGIECSDERTLLNVAGNVIDALQIACPSAWSSAFQAPIDLVKASLLRGVWHLNELNLQYAGTCFALTNRLAHSAGLHRDPEHWSGMRVEEVQARRHLWWNIVFFELVYAHRLGQPTCLTSEGFDTRCPDDYQALYSMYQRAGLASPDLNKLQLAPGTNILVPRVPSLSHFDYHCARFRLYSIFLKHSQQLSRVGDSSVPVVQLNDEYSQWRQSLPPSFKQHFDRRQEGSVQPPQEILLRASLKNERSVFDPQLTEDFQHYLQAYNLEFMYHQCIITLNRPHIDENGCWKRSESEDQAIQVCLNSAKTLIHIVEDVLLVHPACSMFQLCAYFAFNAALILSIQSKLDGAASDQNATYIQKVLSLLEQVSEMHRLGNVAEQAARYSATLKQMLHGMGGDLAGLVIANADENIAPMDDDAAREGAILGSLDPSLGADIDAPNPVNGDGLSTDAGGPADGGPDRVQTFMIPFVGQPMAADKGSVESQTGLAHWSESMLDRPMVDVPVSYPVGLMQSQAGTLTNGSATWPPHEATASTSGQAILTAADVAANPDQYQPYLDLFAKNQQATAEGSNVSDRHAIAFAQHYNHQAAGRPQEAASHRTNLAKTYEQAPTSDARTTAGEELPRPDQQPHLKTESQQQHAQLQPQPKQEQGLQQQASVEAARAGGEPMLHQHEMQSMADTSLSAVAAAAAAVASVEAVAAAAAAGGQQDGDKSGMAEDGQNAENQLMWNAWENFSQILHHDRE